MTTMKRAAVYRIQIYFRSVDAVARHDVIQLRLRSSMPEDNSSGSHPSTSACPRRRPATRSSPSKHVGVLKPESSRPRLASSATARFTLPAAGRLPFQQVRRLFSLSHWSPSDIKRVGRFAWSRLRHRKLTEKSWTLLQLCDWTALISGDSTATTRHSSTRHICSSATYVSTSVTLRLQLIPTNFAVLPLLPPKKKIGPRYCLLLVV